MQIAYLLWNRPKPAVTWTRCLTCARSAHAAARAPALEAHEIKSVRLWVSRPIPARRLCGAAAGAGLGANFALGTPLGSSWPPTLWHAHEMLFGFIVSAIAGFLLTAVPSWTGEKGFAGRPLMWLAGIWLAARLLIATSAVWPARWWPRWTSASCRPSRYWWGCRCCARAAATASCCWCWRCCGCVTSSSTSRCCALTRPSRCTRCRWGSTWCC